MLAVVVVVAMVGGVGVGVGVGVGMGMGVGVGVGGVCASVDSCIGGVEAAVAGMGGCLCQS